MDNFLNFGLEDITNKNTIGPVFEGLWRLYFDSACSKNGANIRVLIESSNSRMKPHAYNIEFECTNNEVEDEVLIQGLKLARNMNIKKLFVFGDFEPVVNQVKNIYGIKKRKLKAYAKRVLDFINHLQVFNITFIHRKKNHHVDTLTVTTSMFTHEDPEMSNSLKVLTLYRPIIPDNEEALKYLKIMKKFNSFSKDQKRKKEINS